MPRVAQMVVLCAVLGFSPIVSEMERAQGAQSVSTQYELVVEVTSALRLVDAASGDVLWEANERNVDHAVAGGPGVIYFSSAAEDGSQTDVYSISFPYTDPVRIGQVTGVARVATLASTGDRLFLLQYADVAQPYGLPKGVTEIALPPTQSVEPEWLPSLRDVGFGILTPEGTRWYGLEATQTSGGDKTKVELLTIDFQDGVVESLTRVTVPTTVNYFSLNLSPEGRELYVVDHRTRETVFVFDTQQGTIIRSARLRQLGSKAPPCASVLSPQGDALYVVGLDGPDGDGIDVIDTNSLKLVGHLFSGRDFYCLALSPDGQRLFASAQGAISTIDLPSGNELETVALAKEDAFPFIILATDRR